jgi:hypothetical protein
MKLDPIARFARVGRIDRSNLGSNSFGVVGPKRAECLQCLIA